MLHKAIKNYHSLINALLFNYSSFCREFLFLRKHVMEKLFFALVAGDKIWSGKLLSGKVLKKDAENEGKE
jgi:hypothetical protein